MYPFVVFSLPPDATDARVAVRYRELIRACAQRPDETAMAVVHAAFEQLRTARARLRARLFYREEAGDSLWEDYALWLRLRPRRRLAPDQLARLIRGGTVRQARAA